MVHVELKTPNFISFWLFLVKGMGKGYDFLLVLNAVFSTRGRVSVRRFCVPAEKTSCVSLAPIT